MKNLTFVTSNPNKAKYLAEYFHITVNHKKIDLPEIQTLSLQEAAESKAEVAFSILNKPVLVEDIGLTFKALKKLPGPLIKWFFETLGNKGLCKLLDNYKDRKAVAEVVFAFYDGKTLKTFSAKREGKIRKAPKGENSWGWDPIFIPKGYKKTWAEMSKEEGYKSGLRRLALVKIKRFLKTY